MSNLPSHKTVIDSMALAEKDDGWLSRCMDQNRYIEITSEFIESLTDFLQRLGTNGIVEICAGTGQLAAQLIFNGLNIIATDAQPTKDSIVKKLPADKALNQYKPDTVIGSFVPFDSKVDKQVLSDPNVKNYIVLNARIGGQFGSPQLWDRPQFQAQQLPQITKWMICRHDVWLTNNKILTHGEAWHLKRK